MKYDLRITIYEVRIMRLDSMSKEVDMLVRMFAAAGVDCREVNVLEMSGSVTHAVFKGADFFIKVVMRSRSPEDKFDVNDVLLRAEDGEEVDTMVIAKEKVAEFFERTEVRGSEDGKEGE